MQTNHFAWDGCVPNRAEFTKVLSITAILDTKVGYPSCLSPATLGSRFGVAKHPNWSIHPRKTQLFLDATYQIVSIISCISTYYMKLQFQTKKQNYFTSSDPHHDMLGGGCQVRVVIENMMGRMENLRTLISGFLGLVILVRWALVTMFLSWTTQTGCRIHRTYVSLIGSGEGRHTTHLLKCVPLLSTSQTDWKQSSDVLSDISFDILSGISSDIFFWYIFWHSFWHIFWHSFWHLSDISFDIFSDKSFDTLSDISSDILSDISFDMLSDISSHILSDISKPKPNIHSFTKKAALQTLYLPRTTQQK